MSAIKSAGYASSPSIAHFHYKNLDAHIPFLSFPNLFGTRTNPQPLSSLKQLLLFANLAISKSTQMDTSQSISKCPDCSGDVDPVPVSGIAQVESKGSVLVAAIRAIEAAESLTEAQKANKKQQLQNSFANGEFTLKILKNKKEIQIKQLRRELAQLLEAGHSPTARIRVEHVLRKRRQWLLMSSLELKSTFMRTDSLRLITHCNRRGYNSYQQVHQWAEEERKRGKQAQTKLPAKSSKDGALLR
ncbi:unnamed protein product [Microthlaspi erraticum]|uniref:Uncharacterized protein n=1 Tax=Microthlaspi erraticum TaxID=1685480 RepID=A0A6D2IWJ1_9BRAS|nr:unnamed protein product [Microthlaspi erraticum]